MYDRVNTKAEPESLTLFNVKRPWIEVVGISLPSVSFETVTPNSLSLISASALSVAIVTKTPVVLGLVLEILAVRVSSPSDSVSSLIGTSNTIALWPAGTVTEPGPEWSPIVIPLPE